MLIPSTILQMLLVSDGIGMTIGEKWTTVLPSEIDVDFFTVHQENGCGLNAW